MIEIIKCSIPRAWYMDHVGKRFRVSREDQHNYIVRTPSGTSNIIKKQDAVYMEQSK